MFRMRGVVHLPFGMLFSRDALGGSLRGATDRAFFTLHLPRVPADADEAGFFLSRPGMSRGPRTYAPPECVWARTAGRMAVNVGSLQYRALLRNSQLSRTFLPSWVR